jgi:hypothetical protein
MTAAQRLAARKARRQRPEDELLHMAADGTVSTVAATSARPGGGASVEASADDALDGGAAVDGAVADDAVAEVPATPAEPQLEQEPAAEAERVPAERD